VTPTDETQWWIYRDGAIVGPVSMDLVVRGLMAGKIPHDARVRSKADEQWVPILSIDDFHDATQKTTVYDPGDPATVVAPMFPLPLESLRPAEPLDDAEREARHWHSPEWMLLVGEKMSGPFSLIEIRRTMQSRPTPGVMICKLHTFDWLPVEEALAEEGEPPTSTKMPVVSSVRPEEPMWMILRQDDDDQGPTSIDQLSKAFAAGRLREDDIIIRFGTNERTPLVDLLKLYGMWRQRPTARDATVVVARKLGSDPVVRAGELRMWLMVFAAAIVIGTLTYLIAR
jgi:hypothetical protein